MSRKHSTVHTEKHLPGTSRPKDHQKEKTKENQKRKKKTLQTKTKENGRAAPEYGYDDSEWF